MVTGPLGGAAVSEYDEREAARFALLTFRQYQRLSREERIRTIAHWRTNALIDAHQNDALNLEYDRRTRPAARSR